MHPAACTLEGVLEVITGSLSVNISFRGPLPNNDDITFEFQVWDETLTRKRATLLRLTLKSQQELHISVPADKQMQARDPRDSCRGGLAG